MELEVPDYDNGLHMVWDPGWEVRAVIKGGRIHVVANRAGLLSLGRLLLTLVDEKVDAGSHWHLDPSPVGGLDPGSASLIIEKSPRPV
jgi:hypothetical protein